MSLVSGYRDIPITGRYGIGVYTYKCVLDTREWGTRKIEIFANNLDMALSQVALVFGVINRWEYIDKEMSIVSIVLAQYQTGTCVLYMEC
jgi:hypothetical protein